ncbi:gamma-glutamyltransferase family protein [Roseateles koreensis]|uniref:Gamma-glutamyltransferase family protein n=1 Tax=Roseateles koreensis TaxID=2987526 RepID=A0ABT5KW33_9BURK|nr:gamma-glutamyltransferase family protein [Roseateles koreensis]MDC8786991.1 gamma-glutamyltransferase family protein [Roseateles koreensis]
MAPLILGCAVSQQGEGLSPEGQTSVSAAAPPLQQPEAASDWQDKPGWYFARQAVAAAHPLAAAAGLEMLDAGGTAMDAGIAAQLVLGLVEPQSSGIGGGAFLMYWDGSSLSAVDGRETAPAGADERLFVLPTGQPMSYAQAVVGGRSVGTPGLLRMLEQAHARFGSLPWARLFEPAIRLCEQGYPLTARSAKLLTDERFLQQDPQAGTYFFDAQHKPWPAGHVMRNPALATVYRQVAQGGADAFLTGRVAQDIVHRVRGHAFNPGLLSEADLAAYQPRFRQPLCVEWRLASHAVSGNGNGAWQVCGFPPPSSGQLTLMQILGMLPEQDAAQALSQGIPGAAWLHRYAEVSNLAFADRAQYIADPDFVPAPGGDWRHLLASAYLNERMSLIGPRSLGAAHAGQPAPAQSPRMSWAPQAAQPEHGTSHLSIVDGRGHALAMTTSIEAGFGSRIMSDGGTGLPGGFLLNNQLTDFALNPRDAQGRPVANRVEPGKRPRSSMSPTLVFEPGQGPLARGPLLMTLGAPGGPAIIHYVAKTLLATHDWGMNLQKAVALPNFGAFNGPLLLEQGMFPVATVEALQARGHRVIQTDLSSGIQAIERQGSGWFGAADPRRDGTVQGH